MNKSCPACAHKMPVNFYQHFYKRNRLACPQCKNFFFLGRNYKWIWPEFILVTGCGVFFFEKTVGLPFELLKIIAFVFVAYFIAYTFEYGVAKVLNPRGIERRTFKNQFIGWCQYILTAAFFYFLVSNKAGLTVLLPLIFLIIVLMTWRTRNCTKKAEKTKRMNYNNSSLDFSEQDFNGRWKEIRSLIKGNKVNKEEQATKIAKELITACPNHYYSKVIYLECLEAINKDDEATEDMLALSRDLYLKTRAICNLSEAHLSAINYYDYSKQYKKLYLESYWFLDAKLSRYIRGVALAHLYLKNPNSPKAKWQRRLARYYLSFKQKVAEREEYRGKLLEKIRR